MHQEIMSSLPWCIFWIWALVTTYTATILVQVIIISGLPWWLSGKEFVCNAGDMGLIPGKGRSPGEGNGNPLQYSSLESAMERRWETTAYRVAKSWAWLSKWACIPLDICSTSSLSPVNGHLGYFLVLAIVNNAAMELRCMHPFGTWFFLNICPRVELQGHMLALFLVF